MNVPFDELDFWSISNWNFSSYTSSKYQVQSAKKIKLIKLHISNWNFAKIKCRQIGGERVTLVVRLCGGARATSPPPSTPHGGSGSGAIPCRRTGPAGLEAVVVQLFLQSLAKRSTSRQQSGGLRWPQPLKLSLSGARARRSKHHQPPSPCRRIEHTTSRRMGLSCRQAPRRRHQSRAANCLARVRPREQS